MEQIIKEVGKQHDNKAFFNYCKTIKEKYKINKKILFIQTPQTILKSFNYEIASKNGYYAFPPLGLQCLYEAIKHRDLDIEILDLNFLTLKRASEDKSFNVNNYLDILKEHLSKNEYGIIAISCMFDVGIGPLMNLLKYLKEIDKSVIIMGGAIASYENKNLLERGLTHFILKGESENKLNFLLDNITNENFRKKVTPNIYYWLEGSMYETQGEPDIVSFNTNMIDSYSLVPIEKYYKFGSLNPFSRLSSTYNSPFATIQRNRGCRGSCIFCSVRDFMGKGVRSKQPKYIIEEMDFLINKRGIKHFEWLDDDLLYQKEDLKEIFKEVKRRNWEITWSANNGLIGAFVDEEMLQLFEDTGCIGFKFGVESGNPETLKRIRKPGTIQGFRTLSKMLQKHNKIFIGANYIVGLPKETFGQMVDSIKLHLELNVDWAAFTICRIIRGASAFSDFEDYFDEQIKQEGDNIKNFIPTRDSSDGIMKIEDGVLKGLNVFKLDYNLIPKNDSQLKEIWFTFNLVCNYILNKNLLPDGTVNKFIDWVGMVRMAYPTNPYMYLFLSLAHTINEDKEKAENLLNMAKKFSKTEYWQERFDEFALTGLLNNFPTNKEEAFKTINRLREYCLQYVNPEKKSISINL